jgi:hypothetical protein
MIDFDKVKTIEDVIKILKAMDLRIIVYSEFTEEVLEISKFLKKED